MRKGKIIISSVALLMMAVMLASGMVLPARADGVSLTRYDCADPTATASEKSLKASEFLSLLTGEAISEAEAKYVDSVLEEALVYTDSIPVSRVTVYYDGSTVHVSADSYSYVSESGAAVEWIPNKIKLGDAEVSMSYSSESHRYEGELQHADEEGNEDPVYVNVEYVFSLAVSGQEADTYRNYAYGRALQISRESEEYELALAAYNNYVDYLEAMKIYEPALDAYEKYVDDKAAYDKALERYQKYLKDKAEYDAQLEEYNKYVAANEQYKLDLAAYQEYLKAKAAYDKSKRAYEDYRAIVDKATAKLAVMENMFVVSSNKKILYDTLWGTTVSEVVDRQDELVNVGKCDPQDIINAGDATERLRSLLKGYKESSGLSAKYAYYVKNYEAIKSDFILLYRSLRQLYENDAVYAGIVMNNKLERYVEFLSHLYVIQSCLDDTYILDESWKIKREFDNDKLTHNYYGYKDVLEKCQIPVDTNNASPNDLKSLPEEVKAPGEEPKAVTAPKQPTAVKNPGLAPDEVDEPKAPTPVAEPKEPEYVAPAEKPDAVTYTSAENAILKAYRAGELKKRAESGGVSLTLTSSCSKLVPMDDRYIVTFYDDDGKTVLYRYNAGYKDVAAYSGDEPQKASTEKYSYTFNGWKNAAGDKAVFGEVTEYETVFYASYRRTINEYVITWIVDGIETMEIYEYGQLPSYKGSTSKPYDERYRYSFVGWSQPIDTVSRDTVYEAVYESVARRYEVVFDVNGVRRSEQYEYGEMPQYKYSTYRAPDETYVYEFAGWDKEISAVTGDVEYTAKYTATVIADDGEGNPLEIKSDGSKYSVTTPDDEIRADVIASMGKDKSLDVEMSLLSGECSVIMTPKAAESFVSNGGSSVKVEREADGAYTLRILDANSSPVTLDTPISMIIKEDIDEYTVVCSVAPDGTETRLAASYADGAVTVRLSSETRVILKKEYPVTLKDIEFGAITADVSAAVSGDRVKFEFAVDDDHLISEITVTGDISGNAYLLDEDNSLIMPDEPVTVSASTKRKVFTVTFVSDGKVVSEKQYFKGEVIEKPADPTKEGDGEKLYTFIEWDPLFVEGATASADVTYNAVFKELLVESQQGFVPRADNRFLVFVITVACLGLLVVSSLITLIIIMKKRKKRSKTRSLDKNR